jgi:cytochrome c-type protein NapB
MKKRLSITLIGLLSVFIYSFSMAENTDEGTTTTESESTTKPVDDAAKVTESTSADSEVKPAETEATTLPQEKVVMPAILGESVLLYSLRGTNDVDEESEAFPNRRVMVVDGGIDVAFDDQPPMVPHNIDKARISLQENSCLKCHSRVDSKLEDAPRPPKSHFRKRDGSRSKKVSAGRYFCTQCHVPQANKKPAVKNLYKN